MKDKIGYYEGEYDEDEEYEVKNTSKEVVKNSSEESVHDIRERVEELKKQREEARLRDKYARELEYLNAPLSQRTWFRCIVFIVLSKFFCIAVYMVLTKDNFFKIFTFAVSVDLLLWVYFMLGISKTKIGRGIQIAYGIFNIIFIIVFVGLSYILYISKYDIF